MWSNQFESISFMMSAGHTAGSDRFNLQSSGMKGTLPMLQVRWTAAHVTSKTKAQRSMTWGRSLSRHSSDHLNPSLSAVAGGPFLRVARQTLVQRDPPTFATCHWRTWFLCAAFAVNYCRLTTSLEDLEHSPPFNNPLPSLSPPVCQTAIPSQEKYTPTVYMHTQIDINCKMRAILIDWIVEVHLKFKLADPTLYLTCHIIDRFCMQENVHRSKLQLVGVTALLIACKYEEIFPTEVRM